VVRLLDRLALSALGAGAVLVFQPWWAGGFRVGFFVVLAATVAHVTTSHLMAAGGGRRR
jgi:hypothetical protein